MSEVWRTARIGDVCEVIAGQSPEGRFYNHDGNGLPFYQGKKEFGEKFLGVATTWTTYETKRAKRGDVLMSVRAPVGPVNFATEDICIGRGLAAIRSSAALNREFLFYALLNLQPKISGREGAVFRSIGKSEIEDLRVPLPSLREQDRIVGLLDEAFAGLATAKANTEKNLQNARELFQSQVQALLVEKIHGWMRRPLSDLCDIKHGYAFEGEHFSNQGDYVLLSPGNFHEEGGYRDRKEKQKYYRGPIPRDYVLSKGDLLVAMTEQAAGLLGSPALIPTGDKFLHNQRLGLVTPKPGVPWLNEFFFHVFNLPEVRRPIHDSASGAKVRHTSPKKIGAIAVSFPSISEQKRLAAQIGSLSSESESLEDLYHRKLGALEGLKKSLLRQAFSGEL